MNSPLDTNLDEAGVHGGCGADHMDIGGGCGADALERGIGWGREGEVLRVEVLGAGAVRGKAVKSLLNEWENQSSHPPPHCKLVLSSQRANMYCYYYYSFVQVTFIECLPGARYHAR